MLLATAIFAFSVLGLAYTYAGYPVLVRLIASLKSSKPSPPPADPTTTPSISVVICARNEAARISQRIRNLLESDYPTPPEIIVVCDGCTDKTATLADQAGATLVISRPQPVGKATCLNDGVAAATGSLIVFTDSRQQFATDALHHLAAAFTDPTVGAVGGALDINSAANRTVGRALDHYWATEKKIRSAQSQLDSTIGCTGAIYAIRRELYTAVPPDTILDDVLIPMQIAVRGYRVLFEPLALAIDPEPLGGTREKHRKERTLAGNLQLLFRYPSWLLPWKNRLALQLVSHKYPRLCGPPLIATYLVSASFIVRDQVWAALALAAAGGLLAAGLAGLVCPALNRLSRIVFVASGFLFLQIAICRSYLYYARWRKHNRTAWR